MDAAGNEGSSGQLPTVAHHEGQAVEKQVASEGGGTFAPAPGHTPGAHLMGSLRGRRSEEVVLVTGSCSALLVLGFWLLVDSQLLLFLFSGLEGLL